MPNIVKKNFSGGINQFVNEAKLDLASQQYLVVNGRAREGVLETVQLPLDITSSLIDTGNIQGLYAIGDYLITFIDGLCYYTAQDNISWQRIADLVMSPEVDQIYVEFVPASSVNYKRKLTTAGDISEVTFSDEVIATSPRAAIVMDGVSQPWAIFPDLTARKLQTYEEWSVGNPEYVPIAKMPMYHPDGILYCIGRDAKGEFTQIFRSVSGQPFNFVVPIKNDGDKTSPSESTGGAPQVAWRVDYTPVSCLKLIAVPDGGFLVTTTKSSFLMFPNYEKLIFAEPTFSHQWLFSVGALNQNCVSDIGGDVALIHYRGVRSFNGTAQVRFQGKNDPFSLLITDLLDGITQTVVATTTFDNYTVFSLTTKHGPALVWYDTLAKSWSSVDLYPGVGLVKQFAVIQTSTALELYFYTQDNKLYKAFAGSQSATVGIYYGALTPPEDTEHLISDVSLKFSECTQAGVVQCYVFHDRVKSPTQAQSIQARSAPTSQYEPVPFAANLVDDTDDITFNFRDTAEYAYKCGVMIEWSARAKLLSIEVMTEEKAISVDPRAPQILSVTNPDKLLFVGDDGLDAAIRATLFDKMMLEDVDLFVGVGDHLYLNITPDPEDAMFKYWRTQLEAGRFVAVPGNHDQDADNCRTFREFMRMSPSRYFRVALQNCALYMMNDGFNTAGTQIEPHNSDAVNIEDSTQFQWLRNLLAVEPQAHRIVVWHQPPYTSGVNHYSGNTTLRRIPLRAWGAHALVSGHNHALERLYKDGFPYFISGGGGATLYAKSTTAPLPETYFYAQQYGYLLAQCWPLTVEYSFKNIDGQIIDQWITRK